MGGGAWGDGGTGVGGPQGSQGVPTRGQGSGVWDFKGSAVGVREVLRILGAWSWPNLVVGAESRAFAPTLQLAHDTQSKNYAFPVNCCHESYSWHPLIKSDSMCLYKPMSKFSGPKLIKSKAKSSITSLSVIP